MVRDAHDAHEDFTSIVGFDDGYRVASRNTDGTLKVWDLRKFTRPVSIREICPIDFQAINYVLVLTTDSFW